MSNQRHSGINRKDSSKTPKEIASRALQSAARGSHNPRFATANVLEEDYEGREINGYKIGKEIGAGGSSKVHDAVNEYGSKIVVKFSSNEGNDDRIIEEAHTLAYLKSFSSSSYMIDFHGAGFDEITGRTYLVEENPEGPTIENELKQNGPLHWERAVSFTLQICDVLAEVHEADVIHRDIKPGNIIIKQDGSGESIKLLDFGAARSREDLLQDDSGMAVGTLFYLAPEIAMGEKPDKRSDLFSVGATLYEMIAGKLPFDDTAAALPIGQRIGGLAVLRGYIYEEIPKPTERNPALRGALPEPLENIIMKLMSKNPEDRFQDARELAQTILSSVGELSENIKNITKPASARELTQAILSSLGELSDHIQISVKSASDSDLN